MNNLNVTPAAVFSPVQLEGSDLKLAMLEAYKSWKNAAHHADAELPVVVNDTVFDSAVKGCDIATVGGRTIYTRNGVVVGVKNVGRAGTLNTTMSVRGQFHIEESKYQQVEVNAYTYFYETVADNAGINYLLRAVKFDRKNYQVVEGQYLYD